MDIDPKMVEKGGTVPLVGLRDQAGVSRELLRQHEPVLVKRGWNEQLTTEFDEMKAIVEDSRSDQLEATVESRDATQAEGEAVTEAKQFKRVLLRAVDDLDKDGRLPMARTSFGAGGNLGRNTARISGYLADMRPHVEMIDPLLAPYYEGQSALAQLTEIKSKLELAQVHQEVKRGHLPQETQKLYHAKGRLLTLIEKLNRIAAICFDGQALLLAQFNKDLILRSRKKRTKKSPLESPQTDG